MIIDEKKITESAECKTAADIVGLTDETIEKVKGISANTCKETEK